MTWGSSFSLLICHPSDWSVLWRLCLWFMGVGVG